MCVPEKLDKKSEKHVLKNDVYQIETKVSSTRDFHELIFESRLVPPWTKVVFGSGVAGGEGSTSTSQLLIRSTREENPSWLCPC